MKNLKDKLIFGLLFVGGLFSNSCSNQELNQYNKNTQYINEDFNNFMEEYGIPHKESLSYSDKINNKKYLVVKSQNSISLSIDSAEDNQYWVDVLSNGIREGNLEGDAYKSISSKNSKDIKDFSDEEQFKIACDYIEAKLSLMHKAGYKNY